MHEAFNMDVDHFIYFGGYPGGAKMLGQLQDAGNVTTLASYLSTLDESRLLCGLQKYASDDARKYNSLTLRRG